MKVLVIGSGAREHAICYKISSSPLAEKVFVAPGNGGTASVAENVPIKVDELDGIANFALDKEIDLVVVGPEYPLSLGLSDILSEKGVRVFGPKKEGAMLESSKSFAKYIMLSAGVPTANHCVCNDIDSAKDALREFIPSGGVVVKADGLAAGKGVFVCDSEKEAIEALNTVFGRLGQDKVVLEERLEGDEASFIAMVHGDNILSLLPSHDYKRLLDGDKGPNTGGMGAVCPTGRLSVDQAKEIEDIIIVPLLNELRERGINYSGFLYAGLILDKRKGINVLEFNVRMGDPECQAILRMLKSDLLSSILSLLDGKAPALEWENGCAVCIVKASEGYPGDYKKGSRIFGIDEASRIEAVEIFHAGTKRDESGALVTSGGRVLSITALGDTLSQARERAYKAAQIVRFEGEFYRKDIAL